MHEKSCYEICDAFSTDAIQDSYLLLVPSNISNKEIPARMIGCSTITEARRMASLSKGYIQSMGDVT